MKKGALILPLLFCPPPAFGECEGLSRPEKIRGIYLNKIRFFSPPEKIFETFASIKNEESGRLEMSYGDFFHALTPFNYMPRPEKEEADSYFKKYKSHVLEVADVNKDGVIDFTEFFFFVTILQLPDDEVRRTFDEVGEEGVLTQEEFHQQLTKLRKKTALGKKQTNKQFMPDARLISATEEGFKATNRSLVHALFKEKRELHIEDFLEIKKELQRELLHYEFHQFDVAEDGTISAQDFAHTMLSCVAFNKAGLYHKRVRDMHLEGRVSFNEFVAFQNFINTSDSLRTRVSTYKYLHRAMLRDLCDEFAEKDEFCTDTGTKISDVQLETLIRVLDVDGNGELSYDEILGVLEGRKFIGQGKEAEFKENVMGKLTEYMHSFQRMIGMR